MNTAKGYPLPPHFEPEKAGTVWRVPYQERADQAHTWADEHHIQPAAADEDRTALILIDVQNTFCLPDFELFVGGRTGMGAVEDNQRLAAFIYRNIGQITHIAATMDTHHPIHIFHALFLVDENGEHPPANTIVSHQDVKEGKWRVNPAAAKSLGLDPAYANEYLQHYTRQLAEREKFELTVWPYHSMLGGIGHALVSAIEEAVFFHSVARQTQPQVKLKGRNPLTEHYSAVGPEVRKDQRGEVLAKRNRLIFELVQKFDRVIIAGQAKSHCLAWTVSDLLDQILEEDPALAGKVYLLEDCTTPIVIPDVVDFTQAADQAFQRFAGHGMHIVRSSTPLTEWTV